MATRAARHCETISPGTAFESWFSGSIFVMPVLVASTLRSQKGALAWKIPIWPEKLGVQLSLGIPIAARAASRL